MAITKLDVSDTNSSRVASCLSSLRSVLATVQMPATEALIERMGTLLEEIRQLNNAQASGNYSLERDLEIFRNLDKFAELWRSPDMDSPIVRAVNGHARNQINCAREAVAVRVQAEHYKRPEVPVRHHREVGQ